MFNVDTVIFDLGRVLVRIDPGHAGFIRLMQELGIAPEDAFTKFAYAHEVRQFSTGELTSEDFYETITARFDADFGFDFFVENWADIFDPMPGMQEIFEAVAARHTVGILSDTDPIHWACIRKMLPWLEAVRTPTLSFNVGCLKPHPTMFATAAANCGREKHNCLFIDDLVANVDGARYFGMPALQFTDPDKLRRDLIGLRLL